MNISQVKNDILQFLKQQSQVVKSYKWVLDDVEKWYHQFKEKYPYKPKLVKKKTLS